MAATWRRHAWEQGARTARISAGSSEFHACVDVTLYLRRVDDRILLAVEHEPKSGAIPLSRDGTSE